MQKTIITIPEPCHADWKTMRPEEKGRFCNACEKIVVDFTNKSPLEIKETLMQQTGKVCGRFKKSDLNRPLEETVVIPIPVPVKKPWIRTKWLSVAAMFTALFAGKKAMAQGQVMVRQPQAKKPDTLVQCKPTATIIRGQVKSIDPAKALARVDIKIYSNGKEISHHFDLNTGYSITVPAHTIWDFKITIEYTAIGFETKVLHDVPALKDNMALDLMLTPLSEQVLSKTMPVFIQPDIYSLGEIQEVLPPPPPEEFTGIVMVDRYEPEEIVPIPSEIVKPEEKEQPRTINRNAVYKATTEKGAEKPGITKVTAVLPADFAMKAYPSPGTGVFTLDIKGSSQTELFVYNLEGRMVLSKKTASQKETLDITAQPNGVYIIKAVQPGTTKTTQVRVVKTN